MTTTPTTDMPPWLRDAIQHMRWQARTYIATGRLPDNRAEPPTPGSLEPVTDTCACHCWTNHRQQPGICTAASTPGATIDGRPACPACHRAAHETV